MKGFIRKHEKIIMSIVIIIGIIFVLLLFASDDDSMARRLMYLIFYSFFIFIPTFMIVWIVNVLDKDMIESNIQASINHKIEYINIFREVYFSALVGKKIQPILNIVNIKESNFFGDFSIEVLDFDNVYIGTIRDNEVNLHHYSFNEINSLRPNMRFVSYRYNYKDFFVNNEDYFFVQYSNNFKGYFVTKNKNPVYYYILFENENQLTESYILIFDYYEVIILEEKELENIHQSPDITMIKEICNNDVDGFVQNTKQQLKIIKNRIKQ